MGNFLGTLQMQSACTVRVKRAIPQAAFAVSFVHLS